MKKIISLFLSFCLLSSLSAQDWGGRGGKGGGKKAPSIKGKITGKLIDTNSKKAVEFATAILVKAEDKKEIDGIITDDKGEFKLENVPTGKYELQLSFVGYTTKTIEGIELTLEKPDHNAGTITLAEDVIALDGVEVVAEASMIENKIDKMVYNAEKDVNITGDASDVLRKVPLLTVDLEGNVSLRGSSQIRVLLNGKTSGMFADNVGDALKMIPAEQIKKVEVITSPTAKYDGEGTAGIINIITKKKQVEGFAGTVSSTIGNRTYNGRLNVNAAKGRFGFNAGGGVYGSFKRDGESTYYREDFVGSQKRTLDQNGITASQYTGFNGKAGIFYDFNAYNSFSSNISGRGWANDRDGSAQVIFADPINNVFQEYIRASDNNSLRYGFDWTNDYTRTFKKEGQEFSLAFQLSGTKSDSDANSLESGDLSRLVDNGNDGQNLEYTIQTDYVHPFSEKLKLEIGAKSVLRRLTSDYFYSIINEGASLEAINDFAYNQDVYAAYAQVGYTLPKDVSVSAGLRYENTNIDGTFTDSGQPFDNAYTNFLPSFIISKKFENFSTIKFSFSRRLQRPSLQYINPYTDFTDNNNISFGNPYLSPEVANQYEVSYNTFIKGTMINAAVYYKNTADVIERFLNVNQVGQSETIYQNIGINNSIGLNVFTSFTLWKIWTIRGGFNAYTYDVESTVEGLNLTNQSYILSGNINSTFSLKHDIKIEVFAFGRSPSRTIQGFNASFRMLTVGAKKELWNKRASLGISITEPFVPNKAFKNELIGTDFYQESNFVLPFRSYGLQFSYRFGKLDFKQKQRRSKVKNDDVKKGEGGSNF